MKRGAYILLYFDHLPKEFEVGTPIVTTDVPLNSTYIKEYQLGIAKKQWDESDLNDVVSNSEMYIENCMKYRYKLSTKQRVEQFLEVKK